MVQKYLAKEKALGRVVVLNPEDCGPIRIIRFGVIPKKHQPGKLRLIVGLYHLRGANINDGVDLQLCSLSYTSVEAAATKVLELGSGSLLAKLDLESAYRMIPVHPQDRPLLGMKWKEETLLDTVLSFVLQSAPKVFTLMADCLQWVFKAQGAQFVIHYLDDFCLPEGLAPPSVGMIFNVLFCCVVHWECRSQKKNWRVPQPR